MGMIQKRTMTTLLMPGAYAVSAYTYKKNDNLDIRNGLLMMSMVLVFTIIGSYVSSIVPARAMGNFSTFMTLLLGIKFIVKPVMTSKEDMAAVSHFSCGDSPNLFIMGLWHSLYLFMGKNCRRIRQ